MHDVAIATTRSAESSAWLMLAGQCRRLPTSEFLKLSANFIGRTIAAVSRRLVLKRSLAGPDALDDYMLRDIGLTRAEIASCKNHHL
jgi:Domain of unknown function (DUF1127)